MAQVGAIVGLTKKARSSVQSTMRHAALGRQVTTKFIAVTIVAASAIRHTGNRQCKSKDQLIEHWD
jgi:hypothetical protein